MQNEAGDTLLRLTLHVDLPPRLMYQAFYNTSSDSLNWKPFKAVETLEEYTETEKLVRFQPDIGFAIKYILSVPEWVCGRVVSRRNWPEENNFAFAIIPWDPEKN